MQKHNQTSLNADSIKIIFFIESLRSGGRERRLIELLGYLKNRHGYEMMVVLTERTIHYNQFFDLNIPHIFIERKGIKKDPRPFLYFYFLCKRYKPDMIHVWESLNAIYALPAVIGQKIPLINSQITSAPPNFQKKIIKCWINKIVFRFSSVILSNSLAGIEQYRPPKNKTRVIYNGIDLERLEILSSKDVIKDKYGIKTPFSIAMVASFSDNKNYDLFLDVAKHINFKRDDITMIAVGDGPHLETIKKRATKEQILNMLFTGRINSVEELVSVIDIGVLFSNTLVHGEGISNSILEYMAFGKPVVANDAGGTREIVRDRINGRIVKNAIPAKIADILINLIEDEKIRFKFGKAGRNLIEKYFTIERMGKAFENIFQKHTPHQTEIN